MAAGPDEFALGRIGGGRAVRPTDPIILAGALASPSASSGTASVAITTHGLNVRASPWQDVSRKIAVLQAGVRVRLLQGDVRPGWAKIMLHDGQIGYIGSTFQQKVQDALTQLVQGNDFSMLSLLPASWLDAAKRAGVIIQIAVGPVTASSESQARQLATLRAFRARAALIARHIDPNQVKLVVDSQSVPADSTRISVTLRGS